MGQVFLEDDEDFSKDVYVKKYDGGYCIIRKGEETYLGQKHETNTVIVSDLTLIEVHDILTKKFLYSETEAHHLIKSGENYVTQEKEKRISRNSH